MRKRLANVKVLLPFCPVFGAMFACHSRSVHLRRTCTRAVSYTHLDVYKRQALYSSRLFTFGEAEYAADLPDDMGFAGFRLMHAPTEERDWLAFLGLLFSQRR